MNLLKAKLGQIRKIGLPDGRHKIELEMKDGRVRGKDLPAVAAVESFIHQAETLSTEHLGEDGTQSWYECWSQKHDRNNWSRDLDEDRLRSLRTRVICEDNTLVAEAVGTPLIPEFSAVSSLLPKSFSARDTAGYISMDYRWRDGKLESIQERRSFPGQPVEELSIVVGRNGLLTLEISAD